MKSIVIAIGAIVVAGFMVASASARLHPVGVVVSDAVASTIRAGCNGCDAPTCTKGGCTGGTVHKSGSANADENTTSDTVWCDTGDHNCGSCNDFRLCSSGS